jgi:hypothetical protein
MVCHGMQIIVFGTFNWGGGAYFLSELGLVMLIIGI